MKQICIKKWLLLLFFIFTLSLLPCRQLPAVAPDINKLFESELKELHEKYKFPGATAAYILPDGSFEVFAVGLADIELGTPMGPDSKMLAASIGKTFVGAEVLALVEDGLLNLDVPISKWLEDRGWFSRLPNHDKITLRHLLNHSSGLANHVESEDFIQSFNNNWRAPNDLFLPEKLIEFVLDLPALFDAGEGWYYSDTNYILAGLIIEKVTGRTYFDEIKRRFLIPLNMNFTEPSDHLELSGLASGYISDESPFNLPQKTTSEPGRLVWNPKIEWTGGGLISNPGDLVIWAKALFEGRVFEGDYLGELLKPVEVSEDVYYGIAVGIHENGPLGRSYGHGGWIPGYCSSLRYYPEHGIAIAFQINTDIGIVDDSTSVVEDMEIRLAEVIINSIEK
jgi:D-alanyl-D-alanine carboxypeptidase